MKNNQPITENEVFFPDDEEIISTTDLKGTITSFNNTFLKISGFSSDELMQKNHNVIRHPDMPQAAFADLWQHLKKKKYWMGIVKNRSKNGDYYWVDAFVSPMFDKNNKIVGYESVRSKPSAERVARAKEIYKQLNAGRAPALGNFLDRLTLRNRALLINIISIISGFTAYWFTPPLISSIPFIAGVGVSAGMFFLGSSWVFSPLQQALKTAQKDINNPLMALIYTGRSDEVGQIQLPSELLKSKLETILSRIKNVAVQIEVSADDTAEALKKIHSSIKHQASETDLVNSAMMQMTSTIQDVADNTAHAAQKALDTDKHSQEGVQYASGAIDGLHGLNQAVKNVSDVVSQLDLDAKNIGSVVDVIKNIAEQTNLLALNAAIEAARAGEHGRGFAVVADEVRTLSGKTQESTQEIQSLIENLNNAVTQAVAVMGSSQKSASDSEIAVSKAIESLGLIANQVSGMKDLNTQIATTVEEQSATSENISKNVLQINQSAETVLLGVDVADTAANTLLKQSHNLTDMVQRFKGA